MTLKMVSVSVHYLSYQPMDEKIKTWTPRFPAKENCNVEKTLFDWPIVSQKDVKAKYQLISPERSLNQPKAMRVCIRSINQPNCSFPVRLLFLFCSRVFISRSYENRSISFQATGENKCHLLCHNVIVFKVKIILNGQ